MKLSKAVVHKYKSFLTEQTIEIEGGITRIVGKNESGKTALLEVLAKTRYFTNDVNFKFDKKMDYPRSELTGVRDLNPEVVTCYYTLSKDEIENIEKQLGSGILESESFSITTKYDNTSTLVGLETNFDSFKNHILKTFKIGKEVKGEMKDISVLDDLISVLKKSEDLGAIEALKLLTQISTASNVAWDNHLKRYIYFILIEPFLPKFWYFSDYFSMPCRINITNFINGNSGKLLEPEEYDIVKALFELSGLQTKDIQTESNYEEFKAQLEATSNTITDSMFEYWTTNDGLEIKFDIEHTSANERYLNIRVYNQKHRVTLPLKNRSKGFLWFFSFLVWFSKIQGSEKSRYILLLDEPGLSLHAAAQDDLLKFIEKVLKPNYQVLYTTHSPFMIDSLKLNEVRTVYDTRNKEIGSIISEALDEKDSDTLFPLQAALGYSIAQNLFISEKNLLVEGISDLVYLNHFSSILKEIGKTGLNEDITIVPVGGADKVATFVSLMRGNKLTTICLLDTFTDQKAKARLEQLTAQKIIQSKKILFYHEILQAEFADIEDYFSKEEYIKMYNGAFNKSINICDISGDKPIMKQLKHLNDNKSFNHYAPSNFLASHLSEMTFSDNTLDNFENLFKLINKLMK